MKEGRNKGRNEGRDEGRDEGRNKGRKEGRKEGRKIFLFVARPSVTPPEVLLTYNYSYK